MSNSFKLNFVLKRLNSHSIFNLSSHIQLMVCIENWQSFAHVTNLDSPFFCFECYLSFTPMLAVFQPIKNKKLRTLEPNSSLLLTFFNIAHKHDLFLYIKIHFSSLILKALHKNYIFISSVPIISFFFTSFTQINLAKQTVKISYNNTYIFK